MVWFFGMRYRILMVLALLAVAPLQAADTHWLDVESRIQYGYYTEDPRALHSLVESLATGDPHGVNFPAKRIRGESQGLLLKRKSLEPIQFADVCDRFPLPNANLVEWILYRM